MKRNINRSSNLLSPTPVNHFAYLLRSTQILRYCLQGKPYHTLAWDCEKDIPFGISQTRVVILAPQIHG